MRPPSSLSVQNPSWKEAVATPDLNLRQIIEVLNATRLKAVYLVDNEFQLIGSITDGDIRRSFYNGLSLETKCIKVANSQPIVGFENEPFSAQKQRMRVNKVQSLPIVASSGKLIFIHFDENSILQVTKNNPVIIMAGGFGKRLGELTKSTPKPMLLVAGKPIIQHIVENFIRFGFKNYFVSLYYKGNQIKKYLGDGSSLNTKIEYIQEKKPLGTAGALGLVKSKVKSDIIVVNGDIFCDLNLDHFLDFHQSTKSIATMAVRPYEIINPFGTIQFSGTDLIGFKEKPIYKSTINAGLYILSKEALEVVGENEKIDMPNVFSKLLESGKKVSIFPIHEGWNDIGMPNDLMKVRKYFEE